MRRYVHMKLSNCGNGGSDSPSKEITIDDVVKFIHDNIGNDYPEFPYTTYEEIPLASSVEIPYDGYIRGTDQEMNELFNNLGEFITYNHIILSSGQYGILLIALKPAS